MRLSKKCQYALRAVLELGRRRDGEPAKTQDIAKAQGISPRFLEVILNELRHSGLVESRRGNDGGYLLARPANEITVGEIVRCIQGPIAIAGMDGRRGTQSSAFGEEAFDELWQAINQAVSVVCDGRTFADLVELAEKKQQETIPDYVI